MRWLLRGMAWRVVPLLSSGVIWSSALAQEAATLPPNLETIDQSAIAFRTVRQDAGAAEIRATLERISLPKGFKIELYAVVPGARHMAVGPTTGILFVGTRGSSVWAVTDRDRDGVADEVKEFAPSIQKSAPNGVAFDRHGSLYVAEFNRLLVFPDAESTYDSPRLTMGIVRERLLPPGAERRGHGYRVVDVGPDGKLYVAIGQPYNVWPRDRPLQDPFGTIVRMALDGSDYEVYARGIRNSVGLDFHPTTGELWFTDNQVDGMGDDIPPGELNRAPKAGLSFGFPWYGGGTVRTVEWSDAEIPPGQVPPEIEFIAHAADLGMTFYTGDMFPAAYKYDAFSAQHGSWDRSTPVGAQVMHIDMDVNGNVVSHSVFASGWLDEQTGGYHGRPVDVVEMPDGAILISDDFANAVYRVTFVGEE